VVAVVDCPQIAPISTNSERPDVATRVRTVEGRFRRPGRRRYSMKSPFALDLSLGGTRLQRWRVAPAGVVDGRVAHDPQIIPMNTDSPLAMKR
jgi:hypothetical protein